MEPTRGTLAMSNLLVLACCLLLSAARADAATVVLDTGHTLNRPGSVGPSGQVEYTFNLRLSSSIYDSLLQRGVDVIRIAADGGDVALKDRTAATGDTKLFVSIHHDSLQQRWIDEGRRREFQGYSVFISQRNPKYSSSLQCARRLAAGMQSAGEQPSLYHALHVKGEGRPLIDSDLGVHRFDDLVVLRTARSPAVLIEVGVIANPDEERRLAEPDVVRRIGRELAKAIVECLPVQRDVGGGVQP